MIKNELFTIEVKGAAAMSLPAAELIKRLHPGAVVFLNGALGAGKTTLVREICELIKTDDLVSSPSFAIINVYHTAAFPIAHFDLYRLDAASQLEEIGADDYLTGEYVVFVEWPTKAADFFPDPDLVVQLDILQGGDLRRVSCKASHASPQTGVE